MSPLLCPPMEKGDDKNGASSSSQYMSSGLKANFETLKKRKVDTASAQKVAEETAYLVQSEIERMRNSVAELEAMLAAREAAADGEEDYDFESDDDDQVDDLPAKNQFPILPPDVIAVPDTGVMAFDSDDSDDELGSEAEEEGQNEE